MEKANGPLLTAAVISHGRANKWIGGFCSSGFVHETTPCPGFNFSVNSCVHFVSDWIINSSRLGPIYCAFEYSLPLLPPLFLLLQQPESLLVDILISRESTGNQDQQIVSCSAEVDGASTELPAFLSCPCVWPCLPWILKWGSSLVPCQSASGSSAVSREARQWWGPVSPLTNYQMHSLASYCRKVSAVQATVFGLFSSRSQLVTQDSEFLFSPRSLLVCIQLDFPHLT